MHNIWDKSNKNELRKAYSRKVTSYRQAENANFSKWMQKIRRKLIFREIDKVQWKKPLSKEFQLARRVHAKR